MFQISSSIAFGEEPTTVDSFLTQGVEYAMKGNLDAAIQDFAEAIRLDPKLVDAYKSRGKIVLAQG